jgi:hypothetical protein
MKLRSWASAAVVVASLGGCSLAYDVDAFIGRGRDASTDASPLSPCPNTLPLSGSSCAMPGLECEYGDDISYECDGIATCADGGWNSTPAAEAGCPTLNVGTPPGCPSDFAKIVSGKSCPAQGLKCDYAVGDCLCSIPALPVIGPLSWQCIPPAGCPFPRPRLGTACGKDGQICDYATACGAANLCEDGRWHVEVMACPARLK